VWAALDCVTAHPLPLAGATLDPPWVLGRLAGDVLARVRADDDLVVMAWPDELDGRKFHSEGALYANGKPVAVAAATWVQLRERPAEG
jgi:acyl-CoA thioesterase FadM